MPLAQRARDARSSAIREILKVTLQADVISFAGGLPAPETFPVEALRDGFDRVLREVGPASLQYSTTEGHPALREWIAARETARGIPTEADEVLVVSGSQQGLDLVAKAFIDEGAPILVESPSYLGALQAFGLLAPEFRNIPTDADGLLPQAIDAELARGARFAYVMPNFQNPSGRTLTAERRLLLAAAAREHDFWLVEDDPYGELWYREQPPQSLRAFAPERTIRLGSFSKILSPGLRIGFVVAPRAMIEILIRLKQATDLHTATLSQRAAFEVLNSTLMAEHLPAIRARYAAQCAVMLEALEQHFPRDALWTRPSGGMFIWVELPDTSNGAVVDTTMLLARAIERRIAFVPGEPFFAGEPKRNCLRLSFVTVPPARIRTGIAMLGELLRESQG
ncbi:MAG TPA: PLP-dependent aminotransferase family protein [Burkholderiaceae bacterium]|nr:PLP-dependent aminotransferase family protein [Burkholderiaceae bacterium]